MPRISALEGVAAASASHKAIHLRWFAIAAAGTFYGVSETGYGIFYHFVPATGSLPLATLRLHTNGIFYGEATTGGANSHGALYSFDAHVAGVFLGLQPTSGVVNQTIGILGQGLTGTNTLKFNGTSASFSIVSDTYISTSVPSGATTGFVTSKGIHGDLRSNLKFHVTPVVLSFNPTSGPVGTQVVITGNSFKGATKVTFGGVKATGNGHREGGMGAIDFYTEWKAIYVDYSDRLQKAQIDRVD